MYEIVLFNHLSHMVRISGVCIEFCIIHKGSHKNRIKLNSCFRIFSFKSKPPNCKKFYEKINKNPTNLVILETKLRKIYIMNIFFLHDISCILKYLFLFRCWPCACVPFCSNRLKVDDDDNGDDDDIYDD